MVHSFKKKCFMMVLGLRQQTRKSKRAEKSNNKPTETKEVEEQCDRSDTLFSSGRLFVVNYTSCKVFFSVEARSKYQISYEIYKMLYIQVCFRLAGNTRPHPVLR